MPRFNNNVEEDLKKNNPSRIGPIANTVVAVIMLVLITVLKIFSDSLTWGLYIGFVFVLICFPCISWYNSWYAKKQKTKMLNTYEKETEEILEYMKTRKKYKVFEESKDISIKFSFDISNEILEKPIYNNEKSSLGFPQSDYAIVTIGIGFCGLEVDPNSLKIMNIQGLLPKSIWLKKKLKNPVNYQKGSVKIVPNGIQIMNKTCVQILKKEDTFYDKKTGWLCIGNPKVYSICDVVEFAEDCLLVLEDGKVDSLWIKIDSEIDI